MAAPLPVVLSKRAQNDVRDLYRWGLVQFGAAQVEAFVETLYERLSLIGTQPSIGRAVVGKQPGRRDWPLADTPYVVVYRVRALPVPGRVEILRVVSAVRRRR